MSKRIFMWLSETTAWKQTYVYYSVQICWREALVSSDATFMQIFMEVLWRGGIRWWWMVENNDFFQNSDFLSAFDHYMFESCRNKGNIHFYVVICSPSPAFHWPRNVLPSVISNGNFTLNLVFALVLTGSPAISSNISRCFKMLQHSMSSEFVGRSRHWLLISHQPPLAASAWANPVQNYHFYLLIT